jgi:hypothetical protein
MDAICCAPELSSFGVRAHDTQRLTVWQQITAEFSGHPLSASYAIEDGVVKVKTPHSEKVAEIGSFNPEWVANYCKNWLRKGKRRGLMRML